MKTPVFLLVIPFLGAATACAAHYTVHPGALNQADSAAYDVLLLAETAIDQARAEYQAGRLPAPTQNIKVALDRLTQSYNVARGGWLTLIPAIR